MLDLGSWRALGLTRAAEVREGIARDTGLFLGLSLLREFRIEGPGCQS